MNKPHLFIVTVRKPISFADLDADIPMSAPVDTHERVCRDCLTDSEIAGLLLPALHFVMTVLLRDWQDPKIGDNDLLRSLHYVRSYISCRSEIMSRSDKDQKEFALRALEGLKNIPIPEINVNQLYSDLGEAIARNMFFAAHPDDLPQSVEEARGLAERVRIFFRNGDSIENYALRDAVAKCVVIFQRYFMRTP